MCCAGMSLSQWQHALWGNCWIYLCYMNGTLETLAIKPPSTSFPRPLIQMLWLPPPCPSQRLLHSAPIFSPFTKGCREWDASVWLSQFLGSLVLQLNHFHKYNFHAARATHPTHCPNARWEFPHRFPSPCPTPLSQCILAEGAIALSVTLSGGALFAS